ncbi:Hypothetical protein SRAE_1000168000 [Strongyloides ratti]|uniref:Uncharacterized protein n=1 Tax=Strongyloides ratti TaxID=34506 RepID=A0A090MW48_STRRB|nr:Hypothetical protein SRAE_1000168000 [Strongyloides ratti]CEF63418.1 Hypothetical protein SRAE_1000168000 [Strongyloides ratti]
MVITIANAATVKRNFEFDQLLIRNIPRYRRELKTKVHDKDSSEESKESDESNENEKISIESSGVNVPRMELIPGRKIHIGSNEGSGMDLNEIEGSGIDN